MMLPKLLSLFLGISLVGFSCRSSFFRDPFGKKTPHEAYADKMDDRGLGKTPEGRAWLAASKVALEAPVTISLPYRQQGIFHADKPRALGLRFTVEQGSRLQFTLTKENGVLLPLYADLFKAGDVTPLLSAGAATSDFAFDVEEEGAYLLRLQPELFRTGGYVLSVSVHPSLGFPVAGTQAKVGSVWGDARDGGKRNHEGIDIFAKKSTPALAATDGYITSVQEGGIGGKVVWLRPEGKPYTLYYAHLDTQLVKEGQIVKKGDVVGLVGNTGNARFTPAHLHFGVYTYRGAVDPLPYVNPSVKKAADLPARTLTSQLKLKKPQRQPNGVTVKEATYLIPLAANASGYLAESPGGVLLQVPYNAVQVTKEGVWKERIATLHPAVPDSKKS